MPFQYSPFVNPVAGSMADLILRKGDIEARSAQALGDLQARSLQAKGQNRAAMWGTLGDLARSIPQEIAAQKLRQIENANLQARTASLQSETNARNAGQANAQQQQQAFQSLVATNRKPDGSTDWERVIHGLQAVNPAAAAALAEDVQKTTSAFGAMKNADLAHEQTQRDLLADFAANSDSPQAFLRKLGIQAFDHRMDPQTLEAATQAVGGLDEAGWQAYQADLLQGAPAVQKRLLDQRKTEADLAKTQADTAKVNAEVQGTLPKTPAQQEIERHNREVERINGLNAGRAEAAQKETERHNRAMESERGQQFDPKMPATYQNALGRAIMSVPAVRRGSVVDMANRMSQAGDFDQLGQVIKQAATESENVDTKAQIRGREATLAALADTRAILGELQAKGVPTDFLSGTAENIARKLGKSTNTEYVRLGNRLMSTLIAYRRAATGVQFSQREQSQYAAMFPNYKNDLPVNLALIDGLERDITLNDRMFWESKLGPDGAALVGAVPKAAGSSDGQAQGEEWVRDPNTGKLVKKGGQ
jgi:hypothetical protein